MIDEDEEADEDELVASDLEQMQNLLEFKVKTPTQTVTHSQSIAHGAVKAARIKCMMVNVL